MRIVRPIWGRIATTGLFALSIARLSAQTAPSPAEVADAKARLSAILATQEFSRVHGATWFDQIRDRISRWILERLASLLGSSALPMITESLIYFVIALAVVLIIWRLVKITQRQSKADETLLGLKSLPSRSWSDWIADAQAASAEGRWRDAVRLVYWSGIVFLEERGTWRPDSSRTPREYLSLVAASETAPALGKLTRLFEHVWYGTDNADRSRFDEAVAHLRSLGCPLG